MKKIIIGVTALALLVASPVLAGDKADKAPWLKSHITYDFVLFDLDTAQNAFFPSWPLAWEGTIQGHVGRYWHHDKWRGPRSEVNGVIRWWVSGEAGPPDYVGRWEIQDCPSLDPSVCLYDPERVIMAGFSAGTNFEPVGDVARWSGKGIVTFVGLGFPQYAKWFGSRTTEGGWYNLDLATGLPVYGEGTFMIFNRPSNKH